MCSKKIERERILPNDPLYPRLFDEHLARYKLAARFIKRKRVLDSACGTGYGSYHLAVNGAEQVYGIDISKEAIDFCQSHYSINNLSFTIMDATNLDFENEYFDVVCAFEIIEHIEEPDRFLNESKRVLKKGGPLIISTPNKSIVSPNSETPRNPYHVREYCFGEFQSLLHSHFEDIEFWGQGAKKKYKIIPKAIQMLPCWIKDLTFIKELILKKVEQTCFLIDRNIFIKKRIEENSPFFLGICKKN